MKFIIIERKLKDDMVELIPIIFPNNLVHKNVYESTIDRQEQPSKDFKCVSAGFWNPILGAHGESETLGIDCKDGTNRVINNIDYYSVFTKDNYPLK